MNISLKPKKSFFELAALFVLLACTVLYAVKPWPRYFFNGLPANHWDPQLMDTWMAWNAHNILRGHFLVPDCNVNFFYPHSYTLAFSELLWPQSFVYALAYALTGNHFFCFNTCMLFFWAFSGVLLYALLRSLDISRPVSVSGGFIYCLMPFRMPYYLEFNMQLVFIFPLMILVSARWLKDPSWKNSLWFCLGYFLSATSCVYYTIMVIIMMIFLAIAFLSGSRNVFRSRQFYLSGLLIVVGCLAITVIYLYPYALLRIKGGYQRSMSDYMQYFAQPMQYLDTSCAALLRWIKAPAPSFAETRLFPGTALGLLTLAFLVQDGFSFCRNYAAIPKAGRWIAAAKSILWLFFWAIIIVSACREEESWLKPLEPFLYHAAYALILLYTAGLFVVPGKERAAVKMLAALSAAAVLCFFISCGPFISTGPDDHILRLARGIFSDMISWNPIFGAVRILTRFSIVILTYLVIAGCYAINRLALQQKRILWLLPVLIAMSVYEAREMQPYEFTRSFPEPSKSGVLHQAYNLPGRNVFFHLPIGMRSLDANVVMSTIGRFSLVIDGLSGFIPDSYGKLFHWEENQWKLDKMLAYARNIWPAPYLIIDRPAVLFLEQGWQKQFPWAEVKKYGQLIAEDDGYSLYRPKPFATDANSIVRYVRTDLLKENPLLTFKARCAAASPCFASVSLNHHVVAKQIQVSEAWQNCQVLLPFQDMGNIKGEEIGIVSLAGAPHHWEVKDIDFRAVP